MIHSINPISNCSNHLDSTYREGQNLITSEKEMDESLISLIRVEIPEGRQNLKDSFSNLERVAEYCEDSYYR